MNNLITNQPKIYDGNRLNFYNDCFPILKKLFDENDLKLAEKIQLHSSHGYDDRGYAIGLCHPSRYSSDNQTRHITISPSLNGETVDNTIKALGVMAHELVHTIEGCLNHGHLFKTNAEKIGLRGKPTCIGAIIEGDNASVEFNDFIVTNVINTLGCLPEQALLKLKSGKGSRTKKIICNKCGYRNSATGQKVIEWSQRGGFACNDCGQYHDDYAVYFDGASQPATDLFEVQFNYCD